LSRQSEQVARRAQISPRRKPSLCNDRHGRIYIDADRDKAGSTRYGGCRSRTIPWIKNDFTVCWLQRIQDIAYEGFGKARVVRKQ